MTIANIEFVGGPMDGDVISTTVPHVDAEWSFRDHSYRFDGQKFRYAQRWRVETVEDYQGVILVICYRTFCELSRQVGRHIAAGRITAQDALKIYERVKLKLGSGDQWKFTEGKL